MTWQGTTERAEWSLKEAEDAHRNGKGAICVRRSQEAFELAVKAVLRKLAIEYPREHDVSDALQAAAERLPGYLKERVEETKSLLIELARVRGPRSTGMKPRVIPASRAFTEEYATEILTKVKPLIELCAKFASE